MKRHVWFKAVGTSLLATLVVASPGLRAPAGADDAFTNFGLLKTIQIPNNPTTNPSNKLQFFDISFVDSRNQRYYLADRSNAGVDVIDAANGVFLRRIGGFTGEAFNHGTPDNDHSGPNGVVVVQPDNLLFAGDGNSSVKVIDLRTDT